MLDEQLKQELEKVNEDIHNYFTEDPDGYYTEEYYQNLKKKQNEILRELGLDRSCTNCKWRQAKFEYRCEECRDLSNFEYDKE